MANFGIVFGDTGKRPLTPRVICLVSLTYIASESSQGYVSRRNSYGDNFDVGQNSGVKKEDFLSPLHHLELWSD